MTALHPLVTDRKHCRRGHLLTVENVYVAAGQHGKDILFCRTCRKFEASRTADPDFRATPRQGLDAKQIARLRTAWVDNEATIAELCGRFRIYRQELAAYVAGLERTSMVGSRRPRAK